MIAEGGIPRIPIAENVVGEDGSSRTVEAPAGMTAKMPSVAGGRMTIEISVINRSTLVDYLVSRN